LYLLNDGEDDAERDERSDEEGITCRRCGERFLHWQKVVSADGLHESPRLFNARNRRHACESYLDDSGFEKVPE
jgi:ribosomal protein L37E